MGISVGDDCVPSSLSSELSSRVFPPGLVSARMNEYLPRRGFRPGGVFARMSTGGDLCVDREENSPYRASLSFVARTAASVTRALCDLRLIPVQGIAAGNYSATVRKLWLGPKSLLPPLVLNIS